MSLKMTFLARLLESAMMGPSDRADDGADEARNAVLPARSTLGQCSHPPHPDCHVESWKPAHGHGRKRQASEEVQGSDPTNNSSTSQRIDSLGDDSIDMSYHNFVMRYPSLQSTPKSCATATSQDIDSLCAGSPTIGSPFLQPTAGPSDVPVSDASSHSLSPGVCACVYSR